ncbi:ABC transporter permease [Kitasatospora sp. NPDC094015]|uniref:ABC transporter permease n=1 Tax=Kitasatospora sp. NPDC094015 TaxID=3155205 RepID=UPI00331A6636
MRTPLSTASPRTGTAPALRTPARFGDLVAAEWIKIRSLRSTPWTLALTTLFVIGCAVVAAVADVRELAHPAPGARPPQGFLPFTAFPPAGCLTLVLVAGGVGAVSLTGEYGSGLIRTTTVAVPARGAVVLAKAVVLAALWTVLGAVVATGSFFASQAVLDGQHAGVGFTHPGVARALVAATLVAPVAALTGLGLGALIRHGGATVAAVAFTLLMLPTMLSSGTRWSADLRNAMVTTAWGRLAQNWDTSGTLGYPPTVAGSWAVYLLWPLVSVAVAVLLVRRRDV